MKIEIQSRDTSISTERVAKKMVLLKVIGMF